MQAPTFWTNPPMGTSRYREKGGEWSSGRVWLSTLIEVGRRRRNLCPHSSPMPYYRGRSHTDGVCVGADSVRSAEGGASSNVGGRCVEGSGSDVDQKEVNEFVGRHTHVEVKAEGSDCHIVIPGDYNLLSNREQVASVLAPLYAAPENEVLRTMSDVELSQNVAGMALRVSSFLFLFVVGLKRRLSTCISFLTSLFLLC